MRLLSYNIRFGGVDREQQIASVIRECDPDLVILQEATRPNVVEAIANAAGMKHWGAKPGYSVAFLSRIEIKNYRWQELPNLRRPFLEIALADSDTMIFGVHLSAIHSNWTERRRTRELRTLLECIKDHRKGFHVLTGDFNTLAPGERLDMRRLPRRLRLLALILGGRVRYKTIQAMLDEGYIDSYRLLCTDDGFTFPTWDPHVRLDYVFVPADHLNRVASCEVMDDVPLVRDASDHFPLLSEIDIK
jgi:exodeoxyribonuclease-3